MKKDTPKLKNLLQIDESQVWDYLDDLVKTFPCVLHSSF